MPKKGRPYCGFSDSIRELQVGQFVTHNYNMADKKQNDIVRQTKWRISRETGGKYKVCTKIIKRVA